MNVYHDIAVMITAYLLYKHHTDASACTDCNQAIDTDKLTTDILLVAAPVCCHVQYGT